MKRYTLTAYQSMAHVPEYPERTARRSMSGMNFDMEYQVWPNRASMAKSIRMQENRGYRQTDWRACVPLSPREGY